MTTIGLVADRTRDRLLGYYPFDEPVLDAVSDAAQEQYKKAFWDLTRQFKVEDGPVTVWPEGAAKPTDVLEFGVPPGIERSDTTCVVHAAFGSSLDNFTRMRAIRFVGALRNLHTSVGEAAEPVTFLGGTCAKGRGVGKLTVGQMARIAWTHNFQPAIDAGMRYLQQSGVHRTHQLGYSFGCDRAHTAVEYSTNYDIAVDHAVGAEPATVVLRSFSNLIRTFKSTGEAMPGYIAQTESLAYQALWARDTWWDNVKYQAGLARPSNIAIGWALKYDGFEGRLRAAIHGQPQAVFTEIWGTASELTDTEAMRGIVSKFPQVYPMELKRMHHAGMEDIDLYAAMMLQGLYNGRATAGRPGLAAEIPASPHSTGLDRVA